MAFVFAASASAIGLGNLWRFPALAARYGGGAFIIIYLILVVTFGFTLMMAEVALGRTTGLSAIGAFKYYGKKYRIIGILESIVPMIILPYYCVIGGWIMKYIGVFAVGDFSSAESTYFSNFLASSPMPEILTLAFILLTMVVVALGVKNGIERLNKVLMPALLVLCLGVGFYALTMPGALDGLAYYFIPHLEDFSLKTVIAAMGQMFFSLSLAMGIMITYGSYMRKEDNLEASVGRIEMFDTLVALLAGFMIIPAVFSFGGEEAARQAGASLLFVTMPQVFDSLPLAQIVGVAFFLLVFFAAITSSISIAEAVVAQFSDAFKWTRKRSIIVTTIGACVLGMLPTLGYSALSWVQIPIGAASMTILDFMDFMSNNIIMPLVALLMCLFIGWWQGPVIIRDEVESTEGVKFKRYGLFKVMIRWVAPVLLAIILVSSALNAAGVITL
jgi:NSS family neurotransmitter:Na+ symporter